MTSESVAGRTGFQQFKDDFGRYWQNLPYKTLFVCLLAAWIALFHFLGNSTLGYTNRPSIFGWLNWVLTKSEDDQHGPWMLVVVLALLWWKRKELAAAPKRNWWPAFGIIVIAILLHGLGYMVQQTRISLVGFFVGIYGIVGVVWGPAILRATFFPMFLFAFCMPMGGTLANSATLPLRIVATKITTIVAHLVFGINVIQDGTRIFDANHTYSYEVAAACSGIRSLTATLALALIYAFVMMKSPWRRLAMVTATIPLAIAANVFRLSTIIIASEAFGQETGKYVHESSWASLMPYIPMIGGILLLGHWLREKRPQSASDPNAVVWSTRELGMVFGAVIGLFVLRELFPAVKTWTWEHQYTSVWTLVALLIGTLAFMARRPSRTENESWKIQAYPRASAVLFIVALLFIVGSGFALQHRQRYQKLGQPGLKVVQAPIYDPKGNLAATNSIALPDQVLDYDSEIVPVDRVVLDWLPKDTTYGQRLYKATNGFHVQMTAILMGTDRTSIHQPQYCLTGAGWHIGQSEIETIRIQQPRGYDLPVNKLTVTRMVRDGNGAEARLSGIYVYWFVADNRLTAEHGQRMLDMGLDMLRTGVLQRWAYVSCFAVCFPGQEEQTYQRIEELITAAVPQFQLTTGQPATLASNP
jgi:exosortase